MELSWLTRIKVTAVLVLGIVVWGVFLWHFAAPDDPMGAVTLFGGRISAGHIGLTILAAFGVGFAAYFLAWPYGREIGILAVPAGLAAWATRSGQMAELMQTHAGVPEQCNIYRTMGWEGFVWFAIAAAGYGGTLCAARLVPSSGVLPEFEPLKTRPRLNFGSIAALAVGAAIAVACISMLAKDVTFGDKKLGSVLGQPANGQIAFAVLVSFGIAAFLVKRFWDASYVWPAIATVIVSLGVMNFCGRPNTLGYMASNWPAAFFWRPFCAILPIQIISFGIIGAIVGYWLEVRFRYWREHESR